MVPWLTDKLSTLYQTQSFTMFAISCHMSLSWVRSVQSMSAILFLEDRFQCFPPLYGFILQMVFPLGFLNKSYAYFISSFMLHTPHISSFVWFLKQYVVKIRDYEPAHNTVFFILLLPFSFRRRTHILHMHFLRFSVADRPWCPLTAAADPFFQA